MEETTEQKVQKQKPDEEIESSAEESKKHKVAACLLWIPDLYTKLEEIDSEKLVSVKDIRFRAYKVAGALWARHLMIYQTIKNAHDEAERKEVIQGQDRSGRYMVDEFVQDQSRVLEAWTELAEKTGNTQMVSTPKHMQVHKAIVADFEAVVKVAT
jgi:hypothetical protein